MELHENKSEQKLETVEYKAHNKSDLKGNWGFFPPHFFKSSL